MIDLQVVLVLGVQQSDSFYICIYIFFFRLFPIIIYYKILNIVPSAIQYIFFVTYFLCSSVYLLIQNIQFISLTTITFLFGNHTFVFYVYESAFIFILNTHCIIILYLLKIRLLPFYCLQN